MGLQKNNTNSMSSCFVNQNALKFKKGAPLKQFFNINLGIGIIKKLLFYVCIFDISLCVFYSKFDRKSLLDVELNSASNEYPLGILLTRRTTPKTRNTWKNMMMMSSSHFFVVTFFQVFLVFGVAGLVKSMPSG